MSNRDKFSDLTLLLTHLVQKTLPFFQPLQCIKHMESYLEELGGAPERESQWMWAATN